MTQRKFMVVPIEPTDADLSAVSDVQWDSVTSSETFPHVRGVWRAIAAIYAGNPLQPEPQAPKHTAVLPVREAFETAFYESALLDGMAELYPMGIKALRVGDAYDVRYGRLNTLWEGWQLRCAIEPNPSSSAQEVRAALAELRERIADDVRYLSDIKRTEYGDGALDAKKGILAAFDMALASAPPVRSNAEGEQ